MMLAVGSNLFTNARSVLMADGARLLSLAEAPDGAMLPDVNVWDRDGEHVARLRRGAWAFPVGSDEFQITTDPNSLTLTRGDQVLVECLRDPESETRYWIRTLDLWTRNGLRVHTEEPGGPLLISTRDDHRQVSFHRSRFEQDFRGIELDDDPEATPNSMFGGEYIRVGQAHINITFEQGTFGG